MQLFLMFFHQEKKLNYLIPSLPIQIRTWWWDNKGGFYLYMKIVYSFIRKSEEERLNSPMIFIVDMLIHLRVFKITSHKPKSYIIMHHVTFYFSPILHNLLTVICHSCWLEEEIWLKPKRTNLLQIFKQTHIKRHLKHTIMMQKKREYKNKEGRSLEDGKRGEGDPQLKQHENYPLHASKLHHTKYNEIQLPTILTCSLYRFYCPNYM